MTTMRAVEPQQESRWCKGTAVRGPPATRVAPPLQPFLPGSTPSLASAKTWEIPGFRESTSVGTSLGNFGH